MPLTCLSQVDCLTVNQERHSNCLSLARAALDQVPLSHAATITLTRCNIQSLTLRIHTLTPCDIHSALSGVLAQASAVEGLDPDAAHALDRAKAAIRALPAVPGTNQGTGSELRFEAGDPTFMTGCVDSPEWTIPRVFSGDVSTPSH